MSGSRFTTSSSDTVGQFEVASLKTLSAPAMSSSWSMKVPGPAVIGGSLYTT